MNDYRWHLGPKIELSTRIASVSLHHTKLNSHQIRMRRRISKALWLDMLRNTHIVVSNAFHSTKLAIPLGVGKLTQNQLAILATCSPRRTATRRLRKAANTLIELSDAFMKAQLGVFNEIFVKEKVFSRELNHNRNSKR